MRAELAAAKPKHWSIQHTLQHRHERVQRERGRAARKLGVAPGAHLPTTEAPPPRPARQLESELAAIDRILDSAGKELGGAAAVGPGVQPLTSSGLVALAAVRREAEEAAAAAAAEMEGQ